jgi:serine/threonine protein kinase
MQVKWSDSAVLKEHVHLLSPECCDLLDKIFVTDPKRRITVPQIMEHPFYTQFLTDGNKVQKASTVVSCSAERKSVTVQSALACDAPWTKACRNCGTRRCA